MAQNQAASRRYITRLAPNQRWVHMLVALVLLAVVVAMFADVLVAPRPVVPGIPDEDMFMQFTYWRDFGFHELSRGNLPLWNPHIFCGCPYIGGFQSAMFYPPNLIFLIMPLATAINASFILHIYLLGLFGYVWTARRGLHPLGGFLAGCMLMFCGAVFAHVYPGHLPHICAMAWAPLVFVAIDAVFERPTAGRCLLGVFAAAMQVLAGHPQYLFYTAVAAAIYCLLRLLAARNRLGVALCLAGMCAGAVALAAVQILTCADEAAETLRSGQTPYPFAAQYSFPPENLLLFVIPNLLGDMKGFPYWGRWFLWEVSPFVGLTGLFLAVYGAVFGNGRWRYVFAGMVAVLLLLALGGYTPLFAVLHRFVPGFDKFRCNGRFLFPMTLFLAMLAAAGTDALIKRRRTPRQAAAVAAVLAALLLLAGLVLRSSATPAAPSGFWGQVMHSMKQQTLKETRECWMPPGAFDDPVFAADAARFASTGLLVASGTCLLLGGLVLLSRFSTKAAWLITALAVAELVLFARTLRPTFDLAATRPVDVQKFLASLPPDSRVVNVLYHDMAMASEMNAQDIWGRDSFVPRRQAELIFHTQGVDLENVTMHEHFAFRQTHKLLAMLRCRYFIVPGRDGAQVLPVGGEPLPRLLLVSQYQVINGRDAILAAMDDPSFDPRTKVILEQEPQPAPSGPPTGSLRLVDSSTDHLTIQADLPSPSILLVTDAYSKGWRIRDLTGSAAQEYRIQPANYALRAVALAAGHHLFRMEYMPRGFVAGKWISIASSAAFGATILCLWLRRRKQAKSQA